MIKILAIIVLSLSSLSAMDDILDFGLDESELVQVVGIQHTGSDMIANHSFLTYKRHKWQDVTAYDKALDGIVPILDDSNVDLYVDLVFADYTLNSDKKRKYIAISVLESSTFDKVIRGLYSKFDTSKYNVAWNGGVDHKNHAEGDFYYRYILISKRN